MLFCDFGDKLICLGIPLNAEPSHRICRGADKSLARPAEKKQLKGRYFSSNMKVVAAAETWLDGQPSVGGFFWGGGWLAKVRVWSL